jgi:hypothetical protein
MATVIPLHVRAIAGKTRFARFISALRRVFHRPPERPCESRRYRHLVCYSGSEARITSFEKFAQRMGCVD